MQAACQRVCGPGVLRANECMVQEFYVGDSDIVCLVHDEVGPHGLHGLSVQAHDPVQRQVRERCATGADLGKGRAR